MIHADDVKNLRERLGVDRPAFARIVGVDTRTVFRWEAGEVSPTGPAQAVILALREKLRNDPKSADRVIQFVVEASAIGGLSYLLVRLLDGVTKRRAR